MSQSTKDAILLLAAIAGILAFVLLLIDFWFSRWRAIKGLVSWFGKQLRLPQSETKYIELKIPTAPRPIGTRITPDLSRVTDIRAYSGAELKRTVEAAPHIDLVFDLPKNTVAQPIIRNDKIKVINTSITIAYDVTIRPKESQRYKATFETIPRIEQSNPAFAVMDLRQKPSGAFFGDFEALLRFELENSSEEDGFNVRVPLVVWFYDSKKEILYQTEHEVVYNRFWQEAHIFLTQGTSVVKMP